MDGWMDGLVDDGIIDEGWMVNGWDGQMDG